MIKKGITMKITKDENKMIVDFEGKVVQIEASISNICAVSDLFNDNVVSEVRNGVFICND